MTKKAAIYVRVSSEPQGSSSAQNLIPAAKRHCAARGWTVAGVFSDNVLTGQNHGRPGLQALLSATLNHPFDILVVGDVVDLARDPSFAGDIGEVLSTARLELHCVSTSGPDQGRAAFVALVKQLCR